MKKYIYLIVSIVGFLLLSSCTKEKQVTINFYSDEQVISSVVLKEGEILTEPTVPVKENNIFDGWYYNNSKWEFTNPVSTDMNLYAQWITLYTITYDTQSHGDKPNPVQGNTIPESLPILQEEGYHFDGWYLDKEGTQAVIKNSKLTSDVTLYAQWTKLYNIIYDHQSHGIQPKPENNIEAIPESLPTLQEEGFRFDGWYLDKEGKQAVIANTKLTKDTTLYAKWTELFDIYFVNELSEEPEPIQNTTNLPDELPTLTDEFATFVGWYVDEDLTTPAILSSEIKEDTVLYAKWQVNDTVQKNLNKDGYAKDLVGDFEKYVNTDAYRVVKTPLELVEAIEDAKYHYQNVWNNETNTYTQEPAEGYDEQTMLGTVHVIEIAADMNLGYYVLSDDVKAKTSIVEDFCRKTQQAITTFQMSSMFKENGMTQIKVENTSNLLIYSKNGAKLTHCGFKLTSDHNVVFRNLQFDEIWQWEDVSSTSVSKVGDYDAFGWAYFKVAFCGSIWIDHCTFGKSYDGQIDYSNPDYTANAAVAFRAPYGADGSNGLHISWCSFNAGSDDKDGYLYQMMAAIEQEYQEGKQNYLYYNKLRSIGASFEDILYGIAIPQKKGFLCGDKGDNKLDYQYNLKLQISFGNCYFKNIEDRLPKLRGGNAYLYNSIIDSTQYYEYRTKLYQINAKAQIEAMGWKCGLVSQGILCGNGGSIKAENCQFKGIEYLLKNNDSGLSNDQLMGGYQLVNCTYQLTPTSVIKTSYFPNYSSGILKESEFQWHTLDGTAPFQPEVIELSLLSNYLLNDYYGVGAKKWGRIDFLNI